VGSPARTFASLEEEADRDLVVAFRVLDPSLVEAALDLGALGLRDADGNVVARAAALVEGEAGVAEVPHDAMPSASTTRAPRILS
jgi:hypothetical protein